MAKAADRELAGYVASAAAGDDIAFARIVAAYHDEMLRVCGFVAGDESIAEDAVQSAWSIAGRKLGSLREAERLRPWLMRVAVNEARCPHHCGIVTGQDIRHLTFPAGRSHIGTSGRQ